MTSSNALSLIEALGIKIFESDFTKSRSESLAKSKVRRSVINKRIKCIRSKGLVVDS